MCIRDSSSSDYLLKPLDDHALLEALDKACAQCEKQQKDRVNTLHANYWKESELPLAEQFFLDLLNGSISSAPSEVMDEIRYRRLNVELIHQPFCPLLIQTGQKSVFAASDNRTLYELSLIHISARCRSAQSVFRESPPPARRVPYSCFRRRKFHTHR